MASKMKKKSILLKYFSKSPISKRVQCGSFTDAEGKL